MRYPESFHSMCQYGAATGCNAHGEKMLRSFFRLLFGFLFPTAAEPEDELSLVVDSEPLLRSYERLCSRQNQNRGLFECPAVYFFEQLEEPFLLEAELLCVEAEQKAELLEAKRERLLELKTLVAQETTSVSEEVQKRAAVEEQEKLNLWIQNFSNERFEETLGELKKKFIQKDFELQAAKILKQGTLITRSQEFRKVGGPPRTEDDTSLDKVIRFVVSLEGEVYLISKLCRAVLEETAETKWVAWGSMDPYRGGARLGSNQKVCRGTGKWLDPEVMFVSSSPDQLTDDELDACGELSSTSA